MSQYLVNKRMFDYVNAQVTAHLLGAAVMIDFVAIFVEFTSTGALWTLPITLLGYFFAQKRVKQASEELAKAMDEAYEEARK